MNPEILFKIAFYVVFFSFAFVMTIYTKKAKARKEDRAIRMKMHHEHEVPLLLRIRQIFGIPFYLGLLVWTFAPRFMEWSAIPFPVWVRWAGLGLGVFSVFLNGFCGIAIIVAVIAIRIPEEEKLLSEQFGNEYREYMQHTGTLLPKFS